MLYNCPTITIESDAFLPLAAALHAYYAGRVDVPPAVVRLVSDLDQAMRLQLHARPVGVPAGSNDATIHEKLDRILDAIEDLRALPLAEAGGNESDRMVSVKTAATLLGVSPRRVRQIASELALTGDSYKVGREWRLGRQALIRV